MKIRIRRKATTPTYAHDAVWFDAQSVRDLFWDVDTDQHPHADLAAYVAMLDDDTLRLIGQAAMTDERLWDAYNEVLIDAIRTNMECEPANREAWER